MPVYSYECNQCQAVEDELTSFAGRDDEYVRICPVCGETRNRKLSAAKGAVFNGEGTHDTGYKSL